MFNIFSKAYNPPQGNMGNLIFAISFGVFVGGFLVFFAPFDLDNAPYPYQPYSIAFFGVISTFAIALLFYFVPKTFPGIFNDKIWKVWHQMVYLLFTIFVIATLNGMYINYIGNLEFSWGNYAWIIPRTFGIAIIPIVIGVLWDYNRKLKSNLISAQQMNQVAHHHPNTAPPLSDHQVQILDHKQMISYTASDILYLEADGNYLHVYFHTNEGVQKSVHRSSLVQAEMQLANTPLKRCHRSYIVNLDYIEDVNGNAQGLRLKIRDTDNIIPVSRKYIALIKTYFNP